MTNVPPAYDAVKSWVPFWPAVHLILVTYNGSLTSGRRSAKRNAAVGGAPTSQHLRNLAADVIFDSQEDQAAAIAQADHWGIHYRIESDHVHFQHHPEIV